ncbi:MAG: O-antigen ligase family protein [Muribaculaceae bacterium]
MEQSDIYENKNSSTITSLLIVVLMFSVELSSYAQQWIERSILQVVIYSVVFINMWNYARRHRKTSIRTYFWILLYLYVFFLLVRLIIDFVIPDQGFFMYKTPATIIFFFSCSILIPVLFFRYYRFEFDIGKAILCIGFILMLCIFSSIREILSGNVVQNNDGRYQTEIFSIGFGQYSASLLLIGLYLLFCKYKTLRIIPVIFITIGCVGVIFSGSRGPFVASIICIVVFGISRIRSYLWLFLALIVAAIIALVWEDTLIAINDYLKSQEITAFDRVVSSITDDKGLVGHTSSRDKLYIEAWEYFLQNPAIGNSYLIPGKIYAHNIVVEQFMATGLFGGCAFLLMNIIAIVKGIKLMRQDKQFSIIPLLYIQYFIYGCLSVTILALFPYWLFLLLTINKADTNTIYGERVAIS